MTIANPVIYRMSSSGDCVRSMVAKQYEHDEVRWAETQKLLERSAEEGNLHERAVKDKLRVDGWEIFGEQDEYVIQILPGVLLVGHGDGFARHPDPQFDIVKPSTFLLEVKSMSSKQFAKWVSGGFKNFPRYAAQITSYMTANPGLDVMYVVKRREDGLVNVTIIKAGETPVPFKTIRSKILTAERYRRKGDYPPCDESTWGCPFGYLHDEDVEGDAPAELTEEMEAVLADLVSIYRELKAREDDGEEAAQERKEKINPSIMNILGSNDLAEVEVGEKRYTVRKMRQDRKWLNLDRLRAEMPEVAEKYQENKPIEFPVVREKKEKK
jgi:hypothetical protein